MKAVEALEPRRLMSAAPLDGVPQVAGAFVRGGAWTASFKNYLQANGVGDSTLGYNVGDLRSSQVDPLSWTNLDQISVRFDQDVAIAAENLQIHGLSVAAYPTTGFTYDADAHVATWKLAAPLSTPDRLELTLSGVTAAGGGPALDGDFSGEAGGDFVAQFNAVPGDVNRDRQVVATDLVLVRNRVGHTTAQPGTGPAAYDIFSDLNADGTIAASDLVLVRNRIGRSLPGIRFGQTVSGSIPVAGGKSLFAFDATTAGQIIYFDSLQSDNNSLSVYIYAPGQDPDVDPPTIVASGFNAAGDYAPIVLPTAGTYRLVVSGNQSGLGDFRFRLLDFTAGSTSLNFNARVSRNVGDGGLDAQIYRFQGTVGQRVFFDFGGQNVVASLSDSDGNTITNFGGDVGPVPLLKSDTYFVTVAGYGEGANFALRLLDAGAAPTAALGQTISGTLSDTNTNALYRIVGSAGQDLTFDALNLNTNGGWRLIGPDGNRIYFSTNASADINVHLDETGEYLLVLDSTQAYSFRVLDLGQSTAVSIGGAATTGALTPGNSTAAFRFNGTAGQRLVLDDQTLQGALYYNVFAAGTQQFLQQAAQNDGSPFVLPATGVYYVLAQGYTSDASLDYSFRLIDVAAQPSVAIDADVAGTLDPSKQSAVYRFHGVAGQHVYFDNRSSFNDVDVNSSWSLYGVNNQRLQLANLAYDGSNSTDFDLILPQTGDYTLLLSGAAPSGTVPYRFHILDLDQQSTPLALNVVVEGSIDAGGATKAYRFSGTAGQLVDLDRLDDVNGNVLMRLVAPDGSYVFSDTPGDSGLTRLPQTGTYDLLVRNRNATAAGFRFRLADDSTATPLGLNVTTTGSLDPGLSTKLFRIAGAAGRKLHFDARGTDGGGTWTLSSASGGQLTGTTLNNDFDATLPADGEYFLVLSGDNAAAPVNFNFQVTDQSDAPVAPGGFDEVHSGSLELGGSTTFTFTGSAGSIVYLDALQGFASPINVQILDPDGGGVISFSYLSDFGPFSLPKSGTYSVVLTNFDDEVTAYSVRVRDVKAAAVQLSLGAVVTDSHASGREANVYSVSLAAGQRVYLDTADVTSGTGTITYSLIGPNSASVGSAPAGSDLQPITALQTGVYHLIASGDNDAPVDLPLKLLDVAALPSIGVDADVVGALDSATQSAVFRFSGQAGQRIHLDNRTTLIASEFSSLITLYRPDGAAIAQAYLTQAGDIDALLPYTGEYVIAVNARAGSVATSYNFRLLDLETSAQPLTFGQTISATLDPGSSTALYSFDAVAGQRVLLDALAGSSGQFQYALVKPDSSEIGFGVDPNGETGVITLTESGRHVLKVRGYSADPAPYSFRLLDVGAQPAVALDAETSGTLEPGTQTIIYRLQGTAGQRLFFDNHSPFSDGDANSVWTLYRPDDQQTNNAPLVYRFGGNDFAVTLPATGEYSLVLRGGDAAAAQIPFSFRIVDVAAAAQPLTLGQTINGTTNPGSASVLYKFDGAIGQRIYLDSLDPASDTDTYQLLRPDGTLISESPDDAGPYTLTQAGTYYVRILGRSDAPSDYAFRLLDTAAAPAITLGQRVTGTLTPGNSTAVFRLDAAALRQLNFESFSTDTGGNWSLVAPDGSYLGGTAINGSFTATPPRRGEYLLILQGTNDEAGVSYDFRVS